MYLAQPDVEELRNEAEDVKKRYFAIAKTLGSDPIRLTRKQASELIGLCKRQLQRWVKRFLQKGIPGLRFRSRRPTRSPKRISEEKENLIVEVRRKSGFGPNDISVLINESMKRNQNSFHLWPSTAYNVLVRTGEIDRERRIQKKYKSFEWGHPNRLIQADLTKFNGVSILTMGDDHSRKGWALAI
jgi:hypothetical protein